MDIVKQLEELETLLRESAATDREKSRVAQQDGLRVAAASAFGSAEAYRISADWLKSRIEQIRKELAK
jgi:hypothetical protein